MNEEDFAKCERIVIRAGGLIVLVIIVVKIILAEVGPIFH